MRILFILVLSLVFTGCAHLPAREKPLVEPRFGMSKEQLIESMGPPDRTELYKREDQSRYEFDIYIRQYPAGRYVLPVCVTGNKVVGWGRSYYQDHIRPDDIRIR
ncbi:MAG: hypothetical protein KGK03_03150 [Candidatus Omnitrophica bacterium]|nr:hypothetical protein [Candidatus Omnitrophota bacterium]